MQNLSEKGKKEFLKFIGQVCAAIVPMHITLIVAFPNLWVLITSVSALLIAAALTIYYIFKAEKHKPYIMEFAGIGPS